MYGHSDLEREERLFHLLSVSIYRKDIFFYFSLRIHIFLNLSMVFVAIYYVPIILITPLNKLQVMGDSELFKL
jgi:hypothetical protein